MEYFKLNNGTQMPMAGIGVFTFTPAEAQAAIESALRDGIRLIDTANAYQNEKATGRAMKASGVKREEGHESQRREARGHLSGHQAVAIGV